MDLRSNKNKKESQEEGKEDGNNNDTKIACFSNSINLLMDYPDIQKQ